MSEIVEGRIVGARKYNQWINDSNAVLYSLPRVINQAHGIGGLQTFFRNLSVDEDEVMRPMVDEMNCMELEDHLAMWLWKEIQSRPATETHVVDLDRLDVRFGVTTQSIYNDIWNILSQRTENNDLSHMTTNEKAAKAGFTNLRFYNTFIFVDIHVPENTLWLFGPQCSIETTDPQFPDYIMHWTGRLNLPDLYVIRNWKEGER